MNALTKTRFIQVLSTEIVTTSQIEPLYKEFVQTLIVLSDNISDYKYLFRMLTFTKIRLDLISQRKRKNYLIEKYIIAAKDLLSSELQLLDKQITNPSFFRTNIKKPNVHLSHRYTKHDLIELISAIESAEVFVDDKGDPIPFIQLISIFENLLGIKLPHPFNQRTKVLERKIHTTKFLKYYAKL